MKEHVHCIAIGGIGVSAMAKYLQHTGFRVTGSDLAASDITDQLREEFSMDIKIGNHPDHITSETKYVVYSPAVPSDNPERLRARKLGVTEYSYPEMLGKISEEMPTIAVAGTNGKTTTTSMIVELLHERKELPTAIVGAILQKYQSNFIAGYENLFVTEACEYKNSFLNIAPDILVITNISEDHLDFFENLTDIQNSFIKLLSNIKDSGQLICNMQDANLSPIISEAKKLGITVIDYTHAISSLPTLRTPGEHNRYNAAAALSAIQSYNNESIIHDHDIEYITQHFQGPYRRMEFLAELPSGALVYDDYAHNPEGLELLVTGLQDHYPNRKIVLVFEPHLYSRTESFKHEFIQALSQAYESYVLPVYRAREKYQPNKEYLLEPLVHVNNIHMIKDRDLFTKEILEKYSGPDYVIVGAGAGPVDKYIKDIIKKASV